MAERTYTPAEMAAAILAIPGGSFGGALSIRVTAPTGSTVTAEKDGNTYTGVEAAGNPGNYTVSVPEYGTYTVTAARGENTASKSVTVSQEELKLDYAPAVLIVGNVWNWGNDSTALTRMTEASDPNGYVNTDITTEPVAAVGTGAGSSPFDELQPWAGMYECNHDGNGVTYRKGEEGFSRTDNDTVIWLPEYWMKVINDVAGSKTYYYLASAEVEGFTKMEGSGKFTGRYKTGGGYVTKSGVAPQAGTTRATCRTQSKAKGGKWRMNDYATWCAYTFLYLVEFADWDSQSKIGRGYVDGNSGAVNTGGTDSMTYHTGRAAGTDGKVSVQYRGIEDPWGNVYEWIDGINFNNLKAYVCVDPSKYADDTDTDYTDTGVTIPASFGWIKQLTPSETVAWMFFLPTAIGGSETTYIPDQAGSGSGWRLCCVGGQWLNGSGAGLFHFYAGNTSTEINPGIGSRLLVDP